MYVAVIEVEFRLGMGGQVKDGVLAVTLRIKIWNLPL